LALAKRFVRADGKISAEETDMLATLEAHCHEKISQEKRIVATSA